MSAAFFMVSPAINQFVVGYGLITKILLYVSFVKIVKDILIAYIGVAGFSHLINVGIDHGNDIVDNTFLFFIGNVIVIDSRRVVGDKHGLVLCYLIFIDLRKDR